MVQQYVVQDSKFPDSEERYSFLLVDDADELANAAISEFLDELLGTEFGLEDSLLIKDDGELRLFLEETVDELFHLVYLLYSVC